MERKEKYEFSDFMEIIRHLRGENGCPWDREQTHDSLRVCMIEEAYEVVDAIERKDLPNLREELGDVLLQVALHSAIAEETGEFTVDEVIHEVSEKMIRRHPHVFGNSTISDAEGVVKKWEEIKREEHNEITISEGLLKVPKVLPSNMRAQKVQKKAAKAGFDFEDITQVMDKVEEELRELKEAMKEGDSCQIDEEYGDLMFSMTNLARFLGLNAENSLTNSIDKFINRFVGIERIATSEGKSLSQLTIDQMNELWERVKEKNKNNNFED
ncbi:nucleoside triphosphate pyrophosphohydrolase [Anaeromicropila populeti]|uniref:MazG family protein n=1 Tax=Anaeromicropila populeti TaxID=37658 RepID=A0A1I6IY15_9FIRM|nr:nucleoside triphosphate pyrophosphohydrolase [Anaeromicropila populeti]SFR71636.1 MazG family protein [Anaeromicropila populeti]